MLTTRNTLKLGVIVAAITLMGCKKKYETPPLPTPVATSSITIEELRDWQESEGGIISISANQSVYGTVTMDENDGNIYKNIYMQDASGAVNVRMLSGGGVYEGDSIRILLNGTILSQYNGVLQIDSVDVDQNIFKISTNNSFPPENVTIDMVTALKESELIRLNNVQFIQPQLGMTFADAENLTSEDRILEDEDGNTIKVRTSGYSSFADQPLPEGSGSITCIVSHFNGDVQLLIRSFSEISMNGERFAGQLLTKNFDDGEVTSDGWTTHMVTGTVDWETSSAGGAPNDYGVISNYVDGSNIATENWLISPAVDLMGADSPTLSFDNAYNYGGPSLQIYLSTDYTGGSPATNGTWTEVPAILSSGGFTWVNSGEIPLGGFMSNNLHVAFKYTGGDSDGSTWELDNIIIKG